MRSSRNNNEHQHHADKLIGIAMSSAGEIVCAMAFVLACLASMPPASAAAGDGGILYIPSAASLAHCPSSCGNVNFSYPFGIGAGCFRQGFELTCNHNTQPPKVFLGNITTQITYIYSDLSVQVPMFFNVTSGSGTNNYNISWNAPAKGVTISNSNIFYALGCDFDVNLFDHMGNPVGSCMSRCRGGVMPNQGLYCNQTGCCSISLQKDISGFQATIVRADDMSARSDSMHPGIMALMSSGYYVQNATDLFSSWTNTSKIDGAVLEVAIMDQPSCEKAQMNNASYACATNNSYCENASYGGYTCNCQYNGYYYTDNNPYLLEGCMPQRQDYNPRPKEHCLRSCGNKSIPFPFGLEEGCFGNERFRLNCTASGEALFSPGNTQSHVVGVSVQDGTLTVSNMINSGKEVVIVGQSDGNGGVLDEFDLSMEYDIVIRWAITNSTCEQAMRNNSNYACRSLYSYCLHVIHEKTFMGYRCNCSSGFTGNPYISDGCVCLDYDKQFDPIKKMCVTPAKHHNLLLGN